MTHLCDASANLFKRRHFDGEIILFCVRWYLTYKLSYRDLQAIMAERNVHVAHTTIMRWVQRCVPELALLHQDFSKQLVPSSETV